MLWLFVAAAVLLWVLHFGFKLAMVPTAVLLALSAALFIGYLYRGRLPSNGVDDDAR